jgi:hypothetical protein
MDKNIIKDYLNKAFITEAKQAKPKDNDGKTAKVKEEPTQEKKSAKGTQGVPGVKVTSKVNKESGKSNKEGVNAIAKEMEAYEKPLTKPDANSSEMATNKFNYNTDEEKTYHDDMEIMNGMEMLQYDRTPDEQFKTRALEAIEGSSKMGNNPDWANVVEKGWGGDKEFGKDLAKRIKASVKKRDEQTPTSKMFGNDWEVVKDKGNRPYAFENTNNQNTLIESNKKQPMKRLKFKKEFNGVGNALKLIPESYKVDSKVFEMTDGNESYKVRWEGSLTEGAAVVLTASDKKMVNEDMDRMKALFNYKSQDTLGLVKGKARVDENTTFTDIWNKTKKLLGESEDIEGQKADAEGEWDDAGVTHAPEAKKHMVQASKMENGHQAPKPKEGQWAEIKPVHAADAKKHIQGSVSTDNGHQAPAPKEGNWEQIKIKGTTGVKGSGESNVKSQSKKPSVGEFSDVKKHAPEASKDIQGSTSNDKGTKAPAPKNGNWDDAKKGQATEAAKHIKKK